jgi:hypothetical protein
MVYFALADFMYCDVAVQRLRRKVPASPRGAASGR